MYAFAERVRSGEWKGVTGKKIEHLVSIGIGGSDLGPVMAYEALRPYADAGIDCRYISNIDPNDQAEKLKGLDPETTLVIIVSKTFTTLETLTTPARSRPGCSSSSRLRAPSTAPMSRTPRPWQSTSSPFPPHSRRSKPSVSTPPTPRFLELGWRPLFR